jgi:hypothetical protein
VPLTGHTDPVHSVAFSPDGKRIRTRGTSCGYRLATARSRR